MQPNFKTDIHADGGLSLSPDWDKLILVSARKRKVVLTNDQGAFWTIRLSRRGVSMQLKGEGIQTLTVPALIFDGENISDISMHAGSLKVSFAGAECVWISNGIFSDTGKEQAARTGHLRRYQCSADGRLRLKGKLLMTQ
jgi:hypothetical protein